MGVRVVECGPFGCTLDRGVVESMDRIPAGYRVVRVLVGDVVTVYVEPVRGVEGEELGPSGRPSSGPPWLRPP